MLKNPKCFLNTNKIAVVIILFQNCSFGVFFKLYDIFFHLFIKSNLMFQIQKPDTILRSPEHAGGQNRDILEMKELSGPEVQPERQKDPEEIWVQNIREGNNFPATEDRSVRGLGSILDGQIIILDWILNVQIVLKIQKNIFKNFKKSNRCWPAKMPRHRTQNMIVQTFLNYLKKLFKNRDGRFGLLR